MQSHLSGKQQKFTAQPSHVAVNQRNYRAFSFSLIFAGVIALTSVSVQASALSAHQNTAIEKALQHSEASIAEALFDKLTQAQKKSLAGQLLHSRLLFKQKKVEDSYDLLEELSQAHQSNVDVQYYFGRSAIVMAQQASIFSKLGYATDALDAWKKAIKLDPQHTKTLSGLISFHVGAPSIAGGDIEQGLVYAKQLVDLDPESGYVNLSKVYDKKNQPDLAKQAIEQGLKKVPESSVLYFTQAVTEMKQESPNWPQTHIALKKALANATSVVDKQNALYQIGKSAALSGQEAHSGIEALQQLLAEDTANYQDWGKYRLAQLYVYTEKLEQAKTLLSAINYQDDDELEKQVKRLQKVIAQG